MNQSRIKGKDWSTTNWFKPPSNFIAGHLFCFGSLVVLDVVCGYSLIFLLDITIENRKK